MSIVNHRLEQVVLGDLQRFGSLSMVPLFTEASEKLDYALLDDAIAGGSAVIEEIGESGTVPELLFRNTGSKPVFVVDGEELIGAKQNRIVNISIMVPAKTDLVIPVSCVEAGRWNRVSRNFQTASRTHFANGRARKMREVNVSMSTGGERRTNQGRVWDEISDKAARMQAPSDTSAAAEMYDVHRKSLDEYRRAFKVQKDQVGSMFMIEGHNHGIDLFDNPETAAAVNPKLVESYALDAIDFAGSGGKKETDEMQLSRADAFLKQIADAQKRGYPAIGMGNDLRIEGKELTGGALEVDGQCIHLCAFRIDEVEDDEPILDEHMPGPGDGRRHRSSRIRRNVNRRD